MGTEKQRWYCKSCQRVYESADVPVSEVTCSCRHKQVSMILVSGPSITPPLKPTKPARPKASQISTIAQLLDVVGLDNTELKG